MLYAAMTWQSITYVYLIPAPFYLTLVLSDTVNTLIRWRPGIRGLQARVRVHQPPRSQDYEKLGEGLGTRLRIHLYGSLVPCPRAPPGEKQSGERSRNSWAYSPKVVMTNEIARSVIIT